MAYVGARFGHDGRSGIAEELAEIVRDCIDVVAERADDGIENGNVEVTDDARSRSGVPKEFFEGVPVHGEHHRPHASSRWHPYGTKFVPDGCYTGAIGNNMVLLLTVWERSPKIAVPMPPPDDKELRISIRVPRAMYEQIKKAAARDHRTMAGWVKALIANALDAEGGAGTRKR